MKRVGTTSQHLNVNRIVYCVCINGYLGSEPIIYLGKSLTIE